MMPDAATGPDGDAHVEHDAGDTGATVLHFRVWPAAVVVETDTVTSMPAPGAIPPSLWFDLVEAGS